MPVVDFLRHGVTDCPGDLAGRTDRALSEEGWRQFAGQTANGHWDAIVASPLRRAREAAERLGHERGIEVEVDARFREIDLGDWDGRALKDLQADAGVARRLAEFYRDPTITAPPNGETWADLSARVHHGLSDLAGRSGIILVVAHAGSIRTALSLATGIEIGKLWALRLDPATRVRVNLGTDATHGVWGEILEVMPS
jgi:alpha-ribazole phosphatase